MQHLIKSLVIILLSFIAVVCLAQEADNVNVTFHIQPPLDLPASAELYISGDFEGWSGGSGKLEKYKANRNTDGSYSLTLNLPANREIQYKFTLGSWASAEQNKDGSETVNRVARVGSTDITVTETILRLPGIVSDVPSLEARIKEIMQIHDIPGLQVAVMDKEGLIWRGAFGYRNLEQQLPVDEETLFRIGSITKMFAAIATLQLAEQGKLSLTDTLHQHASDIPVVNPWRDSAPITLAHLLEHTSGWDDLHDSEYAYNDPARITTKEGLLYRPQTMTSRWVPGTRFSYSNKNTPAAAYVIEQVTDQAYEEYVQEHIFNPLGMQTISFFHDDNYQKNGITPYAWNEAQPFQHILDRAAGSVNSNIKDMEKLLSMFLNRGQYSGGTLITPDSLQRMETPTTSLAAKAGIERGYGLANDLYFEKQLKVYGHNGAINGALASLQYIPELERGYVFMMSSGAGFGAIRHALMTYMMRDYQEPRQSFESSPYSMQFQTLDGYWVQNNPRREILRYINDIASISKLSIDGNEIHFKSVHGGGPGRRYTVSSENKARYQVSGQEEFAIVNDPVDGKIIDISGMTFKKISGAMVVLKFAFVVTWLVISIISVITLVVWIVKRLLKKTSWVELDIRHKLPVVLPLIFLVSYSAANVLAIMDVENTLIGPVIVFVGTIAFAAISTVGLLLALRYLKGEPRKLLNAYAIGALLLHTLMTVYLASYGLIGVQLWA